MTRLEAWLDRIGIDVVRQGRDLCIPSPFKEREKRRFNPAYVDHKRRLSVRIIQDNGTPRILWKCWYTSNSAPSGSFGGQSAYALSVRTRYSQKEIYVLLGIQPDAADTPDEALTTTVMNILQGEEVKTDNRIKKSLQPYPYPPCVELIFSGSPFTNRAERMVLERNILADTARQYGLGWDVDKKEIVLPFCNSYGHILYHQHWDGHYYSFPKIETDEYYSKEDVVFGLQAWQPTLPLIICEGVFDALTLRGIALAGSTVNDRQVMLIIETHPKMIVLAFDNDGAGLKASMNLSAMLRGVLPNTTVKAVYPPASYKDWNDMAKAEGHLKAVSEFCARVQRASESGDGLVEQVAQLLQ